jgi:hypothetical protein
MCENRLEFTYLALVSANAASVVVVSGRTSGDDGTMTVL